MWLMLILLGVTPSLKFVFAMLTVGTPESSNLVIAMNDYLILSLGPFPVPSQGSKVLSCLLILGVMDFYQSPKCSVSDSK